MWINFFCTFSCGFYRYLCLEYQYTLHKIIDKGQSYEQELRTVFNRQLETGTGLPDE